MAAAPYGRLLLLLLLLTCSPGFVDARRLNRYVRHFEPLSYEPRRVHREHVRVRRSLSGSSSQHGIVYFRFQGFDRLFHLKLRPDASAFHKDLVVETSSRGRVKPDIGHIYSGELIGDPSSRVYGGLHDGVFEGSIQSRWGRFYVEGAHKFFARRTPFHSVMYAAKDARMPDAGWKSSAAPGVKHWTNRKLLEEHESEELYPDTENVGSVASLAKDSAADIASLRPCTSPSTICCTRSTWNWTADDVRTRERISTLIAGHVARASEVYRRTDFHGIHDISFVVHKVQVPHPLYASMYHLEGARPDFSN
nr:disintegrin and metalloproteinase domain-containing protein 10-like [Rhipicephalus microplus]